MFTPTLRVTSGISPTALSTHARHVSDHVHSAVLQYVCTWGENDEPLLIRRHWAAGVAPTIALVVRDPDCLQCALATDVVEYCRRLGTQDDVDVTLPAGFSAPHVVDRLSSLQMRTRVATVLRDEDVVAQLADDSDMSEAGIPTWHGDNRWVAYTVSDLVANAQEIILQSEASATPPKSAGLIHHLNPRAGIYSDVHACRSAHISDCAVVRWLSHISEYQTPAPAAGLTSSVIELDSSIRSDDLVAAVEDVAGHVVRIDGHVRLANVPGTHRLHCSAGTASLDALPRSDDGTEAPERLIVTTSEPESGDGHAKVRARLAQLATDK